MLQPAFIRFVVAGGINTAVTLLCFDGLRRLMPYLLAYTITYLFGIGLSYVLNVYFVFKSRPSLRSAAAFPLVYVMQYLVSAALLTLLVERMRLHPTFSALVVVVATIPLVYAASRWLLSRRSA